MRMWLGNGERRPRRGPSDAEVFASEARAESGIRADLERLASELLDIETNAHSNVERGTLDIPIGLLKRIDKEIGQLSSVAARLDVCADEIARLRRRFSGVSMFVEGRGHMEATPGRMPYTGPTHGRGGKHRQH